MQKRPAPSAAYIKSQSGVPADAHYQLSVPWKTLISNIRFGRFENPVQLARDALDETCLKTDAFVATPAEEETNIPVWGTEEQFEQALKELESLELHVRRTGIRPSRESWVKSNAFDGRVASRQEEEEREKALQEGLRILEQETEYDFEAYFLWPDELDIDRFTSQHNTTTFNDIRGSTLCKIEFNPTGIKYVKVSANSEENIKQIYLRVLNMVKEDIAQNGKFVVANRFRLPRSEMFRDRVGLDHDPDTKLYLATLHGNPLPEDEVDDWHRLWLSEEEKNRNLISSAIDMSLKSLQASQRHVRMRITFGELGFSQLELPKDDDSNYKFDEFCSMVVKRRTTIQSMGLRTNRGNLADLVDMLSDLEQFSELESRCVLHFDFEGKNNHILRFESEFKQSYGSKEMEMFSSRWLEFGKVEDSEILQINLLDFEHLKTNCQFHIGAIRLYSPPTRGSQSELQSFESRVRFKATPNGIKAPPRRRAVYPPCRTDLFRTEEVHVARFRFKQGFGYFELQRKDIYEERSKTATPVQSIWSARYYYPEWDNILGEFASLRPGEEVPWPRKLGTFFIDPKATQDFRALPKGFEAFMKEVEDISALLQDAIDRLPELEVDGFNGNGYYDSLMD